MRTKKVLYAAMGINENRGVGYLLRNNEDPGIADDDKQGGELLREGNEKAGFPAKEEKPADNNVAGAANTDEKIIDDEWQRRIDQTIKIAKAKWIEDDTD